MTTLTVPLPLREAQDAAGLTLGERLRQTWADLHGPGAAECPVCGDEMRLAGEAACCAGCGAELH
jgi:predicted amidophosphoribosyltransferase